MYLRGLAYLRLRKGAEAAAEFQKILDHKGASWGSTWRYPNWGLHYSISYLGLARGFALAGDTAKARKAFQDFFELWKDADPDIPILQQSQSGIRQAAVNGKAAQAAAWIARHVTARTHLRRLDGALTRLYPASKC